MVRNSLQFVPWKDYKEATAGLKRICQSGTEAALELDDFAEKWDERYPQISKSWHAHRPNLITLFDYPQDIRTVIYTTNAIESLNSVIRKSVKTCKLFPSDDAALKVIYLAIEAASKIWTMPIRNWKTALNRFMIEFDEQLTPQLPLGYLSDRYVRRKMLFVASILACLFAVVSAFIGSVPFLVSCQHQKTAVSVMAGAF
ncbi:MAG: transposase-like protein [Cellvibrionaceae bacterium]|jgi:transposase-like protein